MRTTAAIIQQLPATFSETLVAHMTRLNFTNEQLAGTSLLDAKSIQNMRSGKQLRLTSVVAVCIGLQLEPVYSMDLIGKSGYYLSNSVKDCAYRMLIFEHYTTPISECNKLLQSMRLGVLAKNK